MDTTIPVNYLKDFTRRKTFAVRGGLPLTKKMWRDGYNRALFDVEVAIDMYLQDRQGVKED